MLTALGQFKHYDAIWRVDREEELQAFIKQEPRLGEFEAQIFHYEDLEKQIMAEKEYYNVGPIALYTGRECYTDVVATSVVVNLVIPVSPVSHHTQT